MSGIQASDIESLIELFEASDWASLHLRVGETELYLGRDGQAAGIGGAQASAPPATDGPASAATLERRASASAPATPAAQPAAEGAPPEGMVAVTAPNLGTFYRAPKPGAPNYIEIGQSVTPDTEICLIEVMKLFTPVVAGVNGVIREVLVEDSQMVEHGQPLFYIESQD